MLISFLFSFAFRFSSFHSYLKGHHSTCKISSVQFSCSVVSHSLRPHGLWHAGLPCPLPTPKACSNSCPLSWWGHPTVTFSVIPFSSSLQSLPALGSFPMSQFFASGGQNTGASIRDFLLLLTVSSKTPRRASVSLSFLKEVPQNVSFTIMRSNLSIFYKINILGYLFKKA